MVAASHSPGTGSARWGRPARSGGGDAPLYPAAATGSARRPRAASGPLARLSGGVVAGGLLFAAAGGGEDGGDWTRFRGDAAATGVARSALPAAPVPVWSFEAEGGFVATPAISAGTVFAGSLDGNLYALDLVTGAARWQHAVGEEIKSSPGVDGGMVYFGDEGGGLHALDAAGGEVRWTFEAEGPVTSSPNFADLPAGRAVLVGSYDNSLYALGAADGGLLWKLITDNYVHATPSVADGFTYVAGCDGLLRKVRLADGVEVAAASLGGYAAASPALAGGRAYVGTFENEVLAVDTASMEVRWRYSDRERDFPFYASAAVTPATVVAAGRDKMIHALDRETGAVRWTFAARARIDASPVVVGERVFGASLAGELFALDLATGEAVWEYDLGSPVSASPAVGGGRLLVATEDGVLFAFGTPEAGSRGDGR